MKNIRSTLISYYENLKKCFRTLCSFQYTNWKQEYFIGWLKTFFTKFLIITFLFQLATSFLYLPKLNEHKTSNLVILTCIFGSVTIIFLIVRLKYLNYKYKDSSTILIATQTLCLIQQSTLQYFLLVYLPASELCVGILIALQMKNFPDLRFKGSSFITFIVMICFIKPEMELYSIIFTAILLIMVCITLEIEQIKEFMIFSSLINLIQIIPQAICIVNQKTNELIYTNEEFEQFAKKLSQVPIQPNSSEDLNELLSMDFLQNLHLEEIMNEGQSINDFMAQFDEEGISDDIYKIKKVLYNKKQSLQFTMPKIVSEQQIVNEKQGKIKDFFKYFRNISQGELIKRSYSSNINLIVEVNHFPQSYIQSALKKQRKKSSICQSKDLQKSYSSQPQIRQSKGSESFSPQKQANQINLTQSARNIPYEIKFLVHIIENFKIQDDELKVYFLNNLNPLMLQTKVKKLEEVKKNLMRSISHEMVTYLNGAYVHLNWACETLKQHQQDTLIVGKLREQIETAFNYVTLQLYKIYDFQDFQDILNSQLTLNNDQIFNLKEALGFCVELLKDQIKKRNLLLNVQICDDEEYYIEGDEKRFKQVILNLLSNAIRFTLQGGITISVSKELNMQDLNELNATQDKGNLLEIRISDSGIGLTQEQLGLLMMKLLSIDEDDKISKNSVGIGMGLSVTKAILKQIGPQNMNQIFVESKIDCGSQFFFYLRYRNDFKDNKLFNLDFVLDGVADKISTEFPIQPLKQSFSSKFLSKKSSSPKQKQNVFQKGIELSFSDITDPCRCNMVLIVDDEQFNIDALAFLLQQIGFNYEQGLNGSECIVKLKQKIINKCCLTCCIYKCIFLDINMPIMNGWETIRQIRQLEQQSRLGFKIPIVAVTGFSSTNDRTKCIREGFNYVIVKPATKYLLQQAFKEVNINYRRL